MMPKDIKHALKLNLGVTLLVSLSGSSLVFLGAASSGSKVERQEFCFLPPPTYEWQKVRHYDKYGNYSTKRERVLITSSHKYCQGDKLYIGVSWRLAERLDENPELRKIHFKKKLPPKSPLAGLYILAGSSLFFIAYLIWGYGTEVYFENLQKLIRTKELDVLDTSLKSEMEGALLAHRYENQKEHITDLQDRAHADMMRLEMGEGEVLSLQDEGKKRRELVELAHLLKAAKTKALTAEELEKEAKHLLERHKYQKKLSDPWEEEESVPLKKQLQEHEGGWIWDIVNSTKPLIIYGESGSYKSYFACCITLLKHHFLNAQLISIADPQWHQNREKAWKELIKLEPREYGEYSNWNDDEDSSYLCAINDLLQRCKERKEEDTPLISIWDELTKLGQYLPNESKVFMPEVISSPRKANEHVILITHNVNQSGLGNVEKMSDAIKSGTFRLMLKGTNEQKPAFKGLLDGWVNSSGDISYKHEVNLPKSLRADLIGKATCKSKN